MEEASAERSSRTERDLSPLWIVATLLRARGVMWRALLAAAILATLGSILIPAKYSTEFSFTPAVPDDQAGAGLTQLAGQFGFTLGGLAGQGRSPQFYADLLGTREILGPIAADSFATSLGASAKVPLAVLLGTDDRDPNRQFEATLKELQLRVIQVEVRSRTTGVITVKVRTTSPLVSYALAKRLVAAVNDFNARTAQQQAAEERRFLESRLEDEQMALRAAEDAQQHFLQTNRVIANSAELSFQLARLQRVVDLHAAIVSGLAQQYEQARIREVRDTPAISLVDQPTMARQADPRGRGKLVLGIVFFAGMVAATAVLLREWWPALDAKEADLALVSIRDELVALWQGLRRHRR